MRRPTLKVAVIMEALMPRVTCNTSRNEWSFRQEGGRDAAANGSEAGGELAADGTAEFSHLIQPGSVCSPTLRVFCQHQL